MHEDIQVLLEGDTHFITKQKDISFKQLFQGFIVNDWFEEDEKCTRYHKQNKVIIQECIFSI